MKPLLLSLLLSLAFTLNISAATPAPKPTLASVEGTTERAKKITYPRLEFREAKVSEIVAFLNKTSKDLDAEKLGVPVELSPAALVAAKDTKITLTLKNVPLMEVANYITNLANLKYEITASKVILRSLDEK
jgi:hypothetical protein